MATRCLTQRNTRNGRGSVQRNARVATITKLASSTPNPVKYTRIPDRRALLTPLANMMADWTMFSIVVNSIAATVDLVPGFRTLQGFT